MLPDGQNRIRALARLRSKLSRGDTVVFVQHPQALQEILTRDRELFVAVGSENKILQPVLGDASVILLQGEAHKRQRQLLMPPLHGEQVGWEVQL